jgi:hypothetical protein
VFDHNLNAQELEHPASHLTDNYKKDEDSNNYKLLDLGHQEHKEIMKTLRLMEAWRDMDNAEGFTLDKIGKNVLELREGRDDYTYRKAIRIKIRGNLSAGLIEDLNIIAAILFEDNFVSISETWHQADYDYEPAAVALHVHNLPLWRDNTAWQYLAFINEIMAGGVGLYTRQSFEFNVGTYHVAATSIWQSAYIICDEVPMLDEFTGYSAVGMSVLDEPYIITDNEPIADIVTDFTAAGEVSVLKSYHAEVIDFENSVTSYSAIATFEVRNEVYDK